MTVTLKEKDNPHCMQCIKEKYHEEGLVIEIKGLVDLSGCCDKHANQDIAVGNVFDGVARIQGAPREDLPYRFKDK